MGSSAQIGKFFIRRSQEQKRCTFLGLKHKSTFWDRTPSHLHIKPTLYVCRRAQESQIFKQNWIILIRSRVIVILLIWVFLALGVGQVGGGYPGWPTIVYMSSGMFRGKESSNRIKMSWLVQDLLNFGFLGSLWLWGGGRWVGGCLRAWGMSPHMCTYMCMHAHACMDMYTCIEIANGHLHGGIHVYHVYNMHCVCACVCVHMCVHVCMGQPSTHPYPPHPNPPTRHPARGDPESVKIW